MHNRCPAGVKAMEKMLIGSTTEIMRQKFEPHAKVFADTLKELEWANIISACS
jgi:hypothetical protein